MQPIKSVSSFIDEVGKFTNLSENSSTEHSFFFRGQSNEDWLLVPSIFRNENLIKNESNIINELFTSCPSEFEKMPTIFDKLVKLQHYDCPTRLLDITSNALVALFFACQAPQNKNGKVFVFKIPNKEKYYSNDERVSILSNLSLQEENFYIPTISSYNYIKNIRSNYHQKKLEELKNKFNIENNLDLYNFIKELSFKPIEQEMDNYFFEPIMDILISILYLYECNQLYKNNEHYRDKYIELKRNILFVLNNHNGTVIINIIITIIDDLLTNIKEISSMPINDIYNTLLNIKETLSIFRPFYNLIELDCEDIYSTIKELDNILFDQDIWRIYPALSSLILLNNINENIIINFNKELHVSTLFNSIKKDIPYFSSRITSSDLSGVIFVEPAKLNNRLTQQDGAFLLYGLEPSNDQFRPRITKLIPASIPNEWKKFKNKEMFIIIDAESKAKILQELNFLGISKQTLFPELDKQADVIKAKYNIS